MRRVIFIAAIASACWAQGTLADYQRAQGLQAKARGLVVNSPGPVTWIGKSNHFWYARSVKGGAEFVLADAATGAKKLAFDHEKLAAAISAVAPRKYTALALPFAPSEGGRGGAGRAAAGAGPQTAPLKFADDEQSIEFGAGGSMYQCKLTDYTCTKGGAIPAAAFGRGGAPSPEGEGGDPVDGLEYEPPPPRPGPDADRAGARRARRAGPRRRPAVAADGRVSAINGPPTRPKSAHPSTANGKR